MTLWFLFVGILICHVCTTAEKVKVELKKVTGAGCPYAAAWLTHVNLFRKATWHLESLKMETATFNIFGPFRSGYQLQDPSYFYVHHMSMFEHQLHKRVGFGEAARQTFILSNVSYTEECFNYEPSKATEYLALIPFYGGLPPNVTMDLRVKSIGQGNSLVRRIVVKSETNG